MALSVVNFRMHHGKDLEQITFSGNGIKLLDLKKEILDKKEISRSLDFDLKIVDENGKVYAEDDEVVPKNASIVVRRVPSKNSLVSRLNNRSMAYGHSHAAAIVQPKGEILMPMKAEVEDVPPAAAAPAATAATSAALVPPPAAPVAPAAPPVFMPAPAMAPMVAPTTASAVAPVASVGADDDVLRLLAEEETTLKRTIPVNAPWNAAGGAHGGAAGGGMGYNAMDSRYGNKGGRGAGAFAGRHPAGAGGYTCNRCQRTGHMAKFCPTIGDPAFDPEIRLMNVPRTGRKVVNTLEGIDTSVNTVIERTDGCYEVFESSTRGLEKLKQGGQATAHIDLDAAPAHLKCALSNELLREAVTLPCCNRNVNDSVIRLRLVSSGLTCPLCNTPGISPDSLIMRKDLREQVDHYIDSLRKAEESPAVSALSMTSPSFPGFAPPPPAGPPPSQHMLPPAMHGGVIPHMAGAYPSMPGMMGGMMMPGQGMFPGMGLGFPPGWDEVPPVEALPLPLSREQFLSEQRLQIILLKEMNGGVLPRSTPAPMGHMGGFQPQGFQQGPGGGRGFGRGAGGFAGRGFRGGGGFDRDFIPGGRGGGHGYQGGYQGGYPEQQQLQQQVYVPKDREYSRHEEPRRSSAGFHEENSAKRRRDESGYDSREERDPRRRSSSRTRPDDGKRPADRPPARVDERLGERMDRERGGKRERSADRKREDSRARADSRERAKKTTHEESTARPVASENRREVVEEHDSKRRRQEGDSRAEKDRDHGREKERDPRDRDHGKDYERSKRDDKDRSSSHKSRSHAEADESSRGKREKERSRERKPERDAAQEEARKKDSGTRMSGSGEKHHRSERDRDHDKPRDKEKEKEREGRDKRRSNSRERGGDRGRDGAKDSGRDKERAGEDTRGKSGSSRSKPASGNAEPEIVFQDRGRDHRDKDRDREKGSKSVLVASNKTINIPPLKSSRAPDSHGKSQRIVKL